MRERSVPEEVMPSVFGCVGMIVLNWSFVENSLDAWTSISFHDHNGESVERQIPRQFGRKVSFLRKCFRRLPSLAVHADEVSAYLDRAVALANVRNYVVHGTLSDFDPADESFLFVKIDISEDKRQHEFGELKILGTDLIAAANELLVMASRGHEITARLVQSSERQDDPK